MDYRKQAEFIWGSRLWGGFTVALLLGLAGAILFIGGLPDTPVLAGFAACIMALAASTYYCPDYLHLTVHAEKGVKWALKVRWRIIAGIAILGAALAPDLAARIAVIGAVVGLTATLLIAKKIPLAYVPYYFWGTDAVLLAALSTWAGLDPWLAASLLAAAAHLSIVVLCQRQDINWWTIVVLVSGTLLFLRLGSGVLSAIGFPANVVTMGLSLGLVAASAIATAFLSQRAAQHQEENMAAALEELKDFTGHSTEEVQRLWRESHQELAKNWKAASIPENDHERMKEWYRQNSGHYLFDISSHNLEYKKLISNLRMLQLAKGACLDYGAGNGEIVLELAGRGHPATYYDVDGETLRFARWRAEQLGLAIDFVTSKEGLRRGEEGKPFDTIFSFDVLEHLPDLPGELSFLAALLRRGGLLVCDVPAGATKNHPMHLNHELNVADHLRTQGLTDRRSLLQRLIFSREKYIFQA